MIDFSLRLCDENDLEVLCTLGRTTFDEAFRSMNREEDFEHYLQTAFSADTIARQLEDPESQFYLVETRKVDAALEDKIAVGYLKLNFGAAQNEAVGKHTVELERIYVKQDYQGQGLGQRLIEQLEAMLRNTSATWLWLGVWEQNKAAIRFYLKNGFQAFDTHSYWIGEDEQFDLMMRKRII
ncbi:GNAT family N-acetyltransferase [Croceiramulus getboli]|nr:GNAT family N-acetyltransferase [Flavobacteriaceae bacterium YJPT1-3]